ncbi:hypothetical protein [Polaromonas sp.]|uniref:hypothetical protein n=1 Tax=Polaromonas sp. TaxID=1869339 RepID=UPI003263AF5E
MEKSVTVVDIAAICLAMVLLGCLDGTGTGPSHNVSSSAARCPRTIVISTPAISASGTPDRVIGGLRLKQAMP